MSHHFLGEFLACPAAHLELVASEFGHQSFRRFAIQAPVDEPFEFGAWHRASPVAVTVPVGVDSINFAEHSGMNHFHSLDVSRVEQTLLAGEENTA